MDRFYFAISCFITAMETASFHNQHSLSSTCSKETSKLLYEHTWDILFFFWETRNQCSIFGAWPHRFFCIKETLQLCTMFYSLKTDWTERLKDEAESFLRKTKIAEWTWYGCHTYIKDKELLYVSCKPPSQCNEVLPDKVNPLQTSYWQFSSTMR